MIYKVLKDFPSRNGVKQYQAGQRIQLDMNSRTKALEDMKYIEELPEARQDANFLAQAIYNAGEYKRVEVKPLGRNRFNVKVEE